MRLFYQFLARLSKSAPTASLKDCLFDIPDNSLYNNGYKTLDEALTVYFGDPVSIQDTSYNSVTQAITNSKPFRDYLKFAGTSLDHSRVQIDVYTSQDLDQSNPMERISRLNGLNTYNQSLILTEMLANRFAYTENPSLYTRDSNADI